MCIVKQSCGNCTPRVIFNCYQNTLNGVFCKSANSPVVSSPIWIKNAVFPMCKIGRLNR